MTVIPESQRDLATTALVLVDLQTWICALELAPLDGLAVAARCADLAARHEGPVVLVRHLDGDGPGADPASPRNAFVPAIASIEGDVVNKYGLDAFEGTALAELLTDKGVSRVEIAGIATAFGVAATTRGAAHHGFAPVVIAAATTSGSVSEHERALADLATVATIR